jgi:hypothetical protein
VQPNNDERQDKQLSEHPELLLIRGDISLSVEV